MLRSVIDSFFDPLSSLLRTVREISHPAPDRMRRKARRLDDSASKDLAKYWATNLRRRSLRLLARARRKQQRALQLRRDAERMDPKGQLRSGR